MNLCGACKQDFGSVSGFDAHRVGKHAYTFWEGTRMDPPRDDGRRCLTGPELADAGWRLDAHGRWRMPNDSDFSFAMGAKAKKEAA